MDKLPARGADRPQHRQLPPTLADVHQERVEDRDERQGDDGDVGEIEAGADLFDHLFRELRAFDRRADGQERGVAVRRAALGQLRADRFGCGLFVDAVFQDDANDVDFAGVAEQDLRGPQRHENDVALLEAGDAVRREQAADRERFYSTRGRQLHLIADLDAEAVGKTRLQQRIVSLLEEAALLQLIIAHGLVALGVDAHDEQADSAFLEAKDAQLLHGGDGGLHAGRLLDVAQHPLVEESVAGGHDFEPGPPRHAGVHLLERLVRRGRAHGDCNDGGHSDDDAQQRERRPTRPAHDLAESELPKNHDDFLVPTIRAGTSPREASRPTLPGVS